MRVVSLPPELDRNARLGWYVWKRYFRSYVPLLTKEDMKDLRQCIYCSAVESVKWFAYANYDKLRFRFLNKSLYSFCKELGLRKPKHSRSFTERYEEVK